MTALFKRIYSIWLDYSFSLLTIVLLLLTLGLTVFVTRDVLVNQSVHPDELERKEVYTEKFIRFMLPKIRAVNTVILEERKQFITLRDHYQKYHLLTKAQRAWLNSLAKTYQFGTFHPSNPEDWDQLLKRVDVWPESLILAQAINESGWGKSRFAKEGNNYFGLWCFSENCGMTPERKPQGAKYNVQVFSSVEIAIAAYLHTLNTKSSYKTMRSQRVQLREKQKPLDSLTLAQGLGNYSIQGENYIYLIQNIIQAHDLRQFDKSHK